LPFHEVRSLVPESFITAFGGSHSNPQLCWGLLIFTKTVIDSLGVTQREPRMTRILVAVVVALLLTNSSIAQSYCDQVRQAVATYGYAAAKRHAMATYSKREVEVADRCVRGVRGVRGGHRHKRKMKT
jgi:predicted nucleic-acid-binding protein